MAQETPFDISQILEHQTEMNTIINETTDNLNEQKNAIADNLSTKKREILFAYSQQQRHSAYNKILLIIVAAIIISVGIYYMNETFPLLPSIFITLIISIICSISIIWGYYIFLEVIRRSKNNYDELDLDRIDTFETIIKEGMSDKYANQTISDLYDNMLIQNKKTIKTTAQNVNKTAQNVNKTSQNVNKTAQNVNKTSQNVNKTSQNVNKTSQNVNKTSQNVRKTDQNVGKTNQNVNRTNQNVNAAKSQINSGKQITQLAVQDVAKAGQQLLNVVDTKIDTANEKYDDATQKLNEAIMRQENTNANIVDIKKIGEKLSGLTDTQNQLQTFTTLKYAPYH
jgi:methyl-accepting chemotaxis protein